MDISRLSSHYKIRVLTVPDVGIILGLYQQNTLFYEYTDTQPTSKQILDDMKQTPPGIDISAKYYFGFFEGQDLVAVMDLIDGYPDRSVR